MEKMELEIWNWNGVVQCQILLEEMNENTTFQNKELGEKRANRKFNWD